MRALVVYYARNPIMGWAAERIARLLDADVDVLVEHVGEEGHGVVSKRVKQGPLLETSSRDPSEYDVVVIGTPAWSGVPGAPVESFLLDYRHKTRSLAVFCGGGGAHARAFAKLSRLARRPAVATLSLEDRDVAYGRGTELVRKFTQDIVSTLASKGGRHGND